MKILVMLQMLIIFCLLYKAGDTLVERATCKVQEQFQPQIEKEIKDIESLLKMLK